MSNSILELNNVEKTYYLDKISVPVLKGVNLKLKPGAFISIMGPSGSGKSTILHLIGGLDNPSSGNIVIGGINIAKMGEGEMAIIRRNKIGFIFQTFNLMPVLTAIENVEIPMILAGRYGSEEIRDKATELLTLVGLKDRLHHKPSELSGGEKQRVSIARSLANDPDIILADEPTGNLDSITGQKIIHLLRWLNEVRNQSFIIVTHNPTIAAYADETMYLNDGILTSVSPKLTLIPEKQLVTQKRSFLISELNTIEKSIHNIENNKNNMSKEEYYGLLSSLKMRLIKINSNLKNIKEV